MNLVTSAEWGQHLLQLEIVLAMIWPGLALAKGHGEEIANESRGLPHHPD